ncbi:hypothetical protein [Thermodesulforhabdus norvegica]|uniref:Uncharacterized protein n=1 Tax=Thermodesulforhabdus norvegica TaxID=39841 RepID=A0A1I4SL80_9BACT|nr:hypothetical protein [Thermodesulforhabdus norvegica]SFM65246.1 hypothetical protein SAMN05660836_01028 [Thermodesulforhabdus norvegica]
MAEVEWKGITWRAAFGSFSVKELLTILKGYGSMEIVSFEKPGCYRGTVSIALNEEGKRDITVYFLEVLGPKRRGMGRHALRELKGMFGGRIFVEDPGEILTDEYSIAESLLFWLQMYREGLIDALDSDYIVLKPDMSLEELKEVESRVECYIREKRANKNVYPGS